LFHTALGKEVIGYVEDGSNGGNFVGDIEPGGASNGAGGAIAAFVAGERCL
jgi:hypothetical protein